MKDTKYLSPDLDLTSEKPIVGIRTGSDSDFSRILNFLKDLSTEKIEYLLSIYSAHRTPEEMMKSAKKYPEIHIPENFTGETGYIIAKVKFDVSIAGGSAHIAGMTASETSTPVIALPVKSSAGGLVDATFSMINMPPGIPNGFVPNQEVALKMVKKLYDLELQSNFTNIQIPEGLDIDNNLLEELGLTIGESPIGIDIQNIESEEKFLTNNHIPIIIPVLNEKLNWDNLGKMKNIKEEGFYMGLTQEENIRTGNALIYAAKIIGIFNPEVRRKVEQYSKNLTNEVLKKNAQLFELQN